MQYFSSGLFEQRKLAPDRPVPTRSVGTQCQTSRAPLRFPSVCHSHPALTSDGHALDVWKLIWTCSSHLPAVPAYLITCKSEKQDAACSTLPAHSDSLLSSNTCCLAALCTCMSTHSPCTCLTRTTLPLRRDPHSPPRDCRHRWLPS